MEAVLRTRLTLLTTCLSRQSAWTQCSSPMRCWTPLPSPRVRAQRVSSPDGGSPACPGRPTEASERSVRPAYNLNPLLSKLCLCLCQLLSTMVMGINNDFWAHHHWCAHHDWSATQYVMQSDLIMSLCDPILVHCVCHGCLGTLLQAIIYHHHLSQAYCY